MARILDAVVDNAVKFTGRGGVKVSVEATTRPDLHLDLTFQVQDTGIGIPDETRNVVFEAFAQGDGSPSGPYDGSGLGLAITRETINHLDGDIRLDTAPDQGTTLTLRIPVEPAALTISPDAQRKVPLPTARADGRARLRVVASSQDTSFGKRILIVEDNPSNQTIASRLLAKLGYETEIAENGLEAVAALQREPFALILMDCQMPDMDGYEATRAIRKFDDDRSATPIVALTANVVPGEREHCLDAGMDDYLAEPVRLTDLEQTVARWIGKPSSEAQGGA